jgi:hypothetical protein
MYRFPQDLYGDVRIEEAFDTKISFKKMVLQEQKLATTKVPSSEFSMGLGGTTAP